MVGSFYFLFAYPLSPVDNNVGLFVQYNVISYAQSPIDTNVIEAVVTRISLSNQPYLNRDLDFLESMTHNSKLLVQTQHLLLIQPVQLVHSAG